MSKCESCDEEILVLYWEGPFTKKEIEKFSNPNAEKEIKKKKLAEKRAKFWKLYSAYGSHTLYGNNVPLYIGETGRTVDKRLKDHKDWFDEQRFGETTYFVASVHNFKGWDKEANMEVSKDSSRFICCPEKIKAIEALLIRTAAPVRNTSGKNNTEKNINNLRLFNTGAAGVLPHEISAKYWNLK